MSPPTWTSTRLELLYGVPVQPARQPGRDVFASVRAAAPVVVADRQLVQRAEAFDNSLMESTIGLRKTGLIKKDGS
jgi:hypothetical protein